MSFKFILGDFDSSQEQYLMEQLDEMKQSNPKGKFFYIVPNHIKFESEVNLLKHLKKENAKNKEYYASRNVQTFSFDRLAWYLLDGDSYLDVRSLSKIGLTMIVKDILASKKEDLKIFVSKENELGFASKLVDQLLEFKAGGFDVVTLEEIAKEFESSEIEQEKMFYQKISDLIIVYQSFIEKIDGKYQEKSMLLEKLAEYLENKDLSNYYFVFSGFKHLTAIELKILEILIRKAKEVRFGLYLDKKSVETKKISQGDLFSKSYRLFCKILECSSKVRKKDILFNTEKRNLAKNIKKLSIFWKSSVNSGEIKNFEIENDKSLEVIKVPSRISEIKMVGEKIRKLISDRNYSYNDIIILAPDIEKYRNLIEPLLNEYKIPIFTDLKQSMTTHPFVEFLNIILKFIKQDAYTYLNVMRLLKTELIIPEEFTSVKDTKNIKEKYRPDIYRSAVDIIENHVLAKGISGKKQWEDENNWKKMPQNVLDVKQKFLKALSKLNSNVKTGQEFAKMLWNFIDENKVNRVLYSWQTYEQKDKELIGVNRPREVWNTFISLLDEYVIALGNDKFDKATFEEIVKVGFEEATYSRIPDTLDRVVFTSIGADVIRNKKVAFIIGADEKDFPKSIESDSILSSIDREYIEKKLGQDSEIFLNERPEISMSQETFNAYLAFSLPSEKLVISYPTHENDGKTLEVSPYVKRIFDFNRLKETSYNDSSDYYSLANSVIRKKYESKFEDIEQILKEVRKKYENKVEDINEKIAAKLYRIENEVLKGSISSIETYYKNPYEYFLKYGLRLRPRKEYTITPADTGMYFHALMENLLKNSSGSSNKFDDEMKKAIDATNKMKDFKIFNDNSKFKYLKSQLNNTARQVGGIIWKQQKVYNLKTLKTELNFKFKPKFESSAKPELKEADKPEVKTFDKLELNGRIDRIDILNDEFLSIVDYKSGNITSKMKNFEKKMIAGIDIQLITYLDYLKENKQRVLGNKYKEAEVGGAFYLQFLQSVLDMKFSAEEFVKLHQYDGIVLDEFAEEIKSDINSFKIYKPLTLLKSGKFKNINKKISSFDGWIEKNKEKLKDAYDKIIGGEIALNPYKLNDENGLKYSDYQSIMLFDPLVGNQYNDISRIDTNINKEKK